jgi:Flp pilus assembly protein protease CpaA
MSSHYTNCYFWLAEIGTYLGLRHWAPRVVAYYGRTYFETPTGKPGMWWRLLVLLPAGVLLAWAAQFYGKEALPFLGLILVALGGLTLSDAKFQVIPDRFQLAGAIGAAGFAFLSSNAALQAKFVSAGLGLGIVAVLYGTTRLYTLLRKRDALGFGDIKLLAWLALAFGPDTFFVLIYGLLLALVAVVPLILLRQKAMRSSFAFGPFLAGAAILRLVELTLMR